MLNKPKGLQREGKIESKEQLRRKKKKQHSERTHYRKIQKEQEHLGGKEREQSREVVFKAEGV